MSKGDPTSPDALPGDDAECDGAVEPCPLNCPDKVAFEEHNTVYGFDDFTDAAVPWKSVEKGQSDTAMAEIDPPDKFANVKFASSDPATVTVEPDTAAGGSQVVTVKGLDNGEAEITATCGGGELGKMKVKTYTRKIKTVAVRLVHEKNYQSTDIADADIEARLKKVYIQAVVEFQLTRLDAMTVEFDKDGDGMIDVNSWMSEEMRIIRDACKDDSYDFNVFLVSKPTDGSFGFMDFNQRYGFVHPEQTTTPLKTFAHELGHGQGLAHPAADADNLMSQGEGDTMWRLRKDQWDTLNP